MYEIDPKPNSDQAICENCECIVDKLNIRVTIKGDAGCIECILNCRWCGKFHFKQDMYLCPYYGLTCDDCLNNDDYRKAVKDKVIHKALRCYFDETMNKRIEQNIIQVAHTLGFDELANEMRNDL